MRLAGRRRPPIRVPAGEKVLAWAEGPEGVVAGTRDAVHLRLGPSAAGTSTGSVERSDPAVEPVETRIPWEQVQAADWDQETSLLRLSEMGHWGEPRPVHRLTLEEPGRLLELLRERVTASVVLQRHVPVRDRRGVRVIARRAPRGDQPISWFLEYDQGIDPDDPEVRQVAEQALAAARDEVGPR